MDAEFLSGGLWKPQPGQKIRRDSLRWCIGVRHVQLAHLALATLCVGCLRAATLVGAAAARANSTLITSDNGDQSHWQIYGLDYRIHGMVMASYWLGHALSPLPLRWMLSWAAAPLPEGSRGLRPLAGPCGLRPTPLLAVALAVGAASALTMPSLLVRGAWRWSCLTSMAGGAAAAAGAPGGPLLTALLRRWVPPNEASAALNVVCFSMYRVVDLPGVQIGLALGLLACGSSTSLWLSWRAPWLLGGGAALAAAVCVALLTDDTPDKHPAVGDAEKQWIKDAISEAISQSESPVEPSWSDLLRCGALWGAVASRASLATVFIVLLTYGSDYLKLTGTTQEEATSLLMRSLLCELALAGMGQSLARRWKPEPAKGPIYWKLLNALGSVMVVAVLTALGGPAPGARARWLLLAALAAHGLVAPWAQESVRDSLSVGSAERVLQAAGLCAAVVAAGAAVLAAETFMSGVNPAGSLVDMQYPWRCLFLGLAALTVLGQGTHWLLTPSQLRPAADAGGANNALPTARDAASDTRLLEKDG